MEIFIDSCFYLGLVHPKDQNSRRSDEILEEINLGKYGLIYTSKLVVQETITLVGARTLGSSAALDNLWNLIWGKDKIAQLLTINQEIEKKSWELFRKVNTDIKMKNQIMSYVDVSSVILANHNKIKKIISFDGHFDKFLIRIY